MQANATILPVLGGLAALGVLALPAAAVPGDPSEKIQKIRFIEDDAQNPMTSKIYELKHRKANDVVPFLLGAIKRYAKNGSADRINYAAAKKQLVCVSCPAPLIPYLDDMIAKLDRPAPIEGTGIVRNVYTPVWRAGENMVNIMVKAGISSNASEGANQDATVAFDAAANRIYWKDSINKNRDLLKYLAWLDRPLPQCTLEVKVYEVRESDLLDLGLDYLAWKNGPGLNLFEAGATLLSGTALESAFGPYGFFAFAPSFDLSFVRLLAQNGRAGIASGGRLALTTGHAASMQFTPEYQNLTKDDAFASAVAASGNDDWKLEVASPVIALSGRTDGKTGQLSTETGAVVNFRYELTMKTVTARDNRGAELYESGTSAGSVSVSTGAERLLSRYVREVETEQTVGVPFLCELPVLKYIFGTTTRNREKVHCFVTVRVELLRPDAELAALSGKLADIPNLLQPNQPDQPINR